MQNKLPVEVWDLILKPVFDLRFKVNIEDDGNVTSLPNENTLHPSSPAYLKLRLVSKLFHAILTPYCFREIVIKDDEYSLERLQKITNSPSLAIHLKTYTYEFTTSDPRELAYTFHSDLYLQYLAWDEKQQAEHFAQLTEVAQNDIQRTTKLHEFLLSGDIYRIHVDCLTSLPNLRSLYLSTLGYGLPAVMLQGGQKSIGCGTATLRAFFEICYRRTQLADKFPRIEILTVEGLTQECLNLSPKLIQQACIGMSAIKEASFSIEYGSDDAFRWLNVLGRLLRSAETLETLSIFPCTVEAFLSFQALAVASAPSFAKDHKICKEPSLRSHHWTSLSNLNLQNVVCELEPFLSFLKLHKPTLDNVSLMQCSTRLTTRPKHPLHSSLYLADADADPIAEERDGEGWHKVFTSLKRFEPVSKAFRQFQLMQLSAGVTGHAHMSDKEASLWQQWLEGTLTEEPAWPALEDDDETSWCPVCRSSSEELYEDYGEDDDNYGPWSPPPGFLGDVWDDAHDAHDGHVWAGPLGNLYDDGLPMVDYEGLDYDDNYVEEDTDGDDDEDMPPLA